ncbi:16S rRNA (cytosine(1402)-N(4))-methyltransferase RsmH [bacterium]|nr:16S rRNA (cytosine(1402)-N(4))-methyltransferase RsmH [bacterium]
MTEHKTVMLQEAVQWLAPKGDGWWADCTVGGGGHTEALLAATAPHGRVLGLDQDEAALDRAQERLASYGSRLVLVRNNFRNLVAVAGEMKITGFSGVLMDLGVSSFQIDTATRGFSFLQPGPLDMRMDQRHGVTAADIVNHADEKELADIFYRLGEERRSRQLAHLVVKNRPLQSTDELAALARRAVGRSGKIHPATRAFQALRIAVNEELDSLREVLAAASQTMCLGGRMVVISFHSLEDRIVKETFRLSGWERLTKHVIRPSEAETAGNSRARSARLRAAIWQGGDQNDR